MNAQRRLEARLSLKTHPFPDAPGSSSECWGQIRLSISEVAGPIFEWEWDLLAAAEWYVENREALWTGRLPDVSVEESLADALERLQQREFSDAETATEDAWLDDLYEFRSQHSLRFALRGADIPEIIIGCNRGSGEISSARPTAWRYSFDAGDFQRVFESELLKLIDKWRSDPIDPAASARAVKVEQGIRNAPPPPTRCE